MTLVELNQLDAAERAEADRLRRDTRTAAIMDAPEAAAEERRLIAFALLLRLDLSPDAARLFLRQAPASARSTRWPRGSERSHANLTRRHDIDRFPRIRTAG